MGNQKGGEYDTVGFRELRKQLEGRTRVSRSRTPAPMPMYWYKTDIPFYQCKKAWIRHPRSQSRADMRDGRMHSTKSSLPVHLKPQVVRDPTAKYRKSTQAKRLEDVVTVSMMNGREKCVPGEEGRLGLQPDPKWLAQQCNSLKPKGNQWTEGQLAWLQEPSKDNEDVKNLVCSCRHSAQP